MKRILIGSIILLAAIGTAQAHDRKKEVVEIECPINYRLDLETNTCLLIDDDDQTEISFLDDLTVEQDLDWPGNSDNHRQDINRAQRTGNNGRGTTDALDGGNPPGKGNFRNDLN